jgi:E1-E2 ATPase
MKLKNNGASAPPLKIEALRGGIVRLSGPALEEALLPAHRREFLDRCFAVPTLNTLRLAGTGISVDLWFQRNQIPLSESVEGLAAAMRSRDPGAWDLAHDEIVFSASQGRAVEIYRSGPELTFWRIEAVGRDRYRCFHPLIRIGRVRKCLLEDLATLAGVREESASSLADDCILVRVQPNRVSAEHLLDVMEPAIARALEEKYPPPIEISPRRLIVNANLGLAIISDYVFPAVGYFNAACTSLLNYRNVQQAWASLRQGTFTLSALHSTLYGMGLIAFDWIGDAVMYWTSEFWPRRVNRLRQESQRQFLARYRACPRRVWVERGGAQIEVCLEDLQPGEILILRPGDVIPGDGTVVKGSGEVLESWITGQEGSVIKKPRDPLFASSEVVAGELHISISAVGSATLAAHLAAWFETVFQKPHPRTHARELGETMALPVFILTIASLSRGGIHMAKGVGHPDFRSGPGIAAELSDLAATLQAGTLGVFIASPETLSKIAEADCFMIDDSAAAWYCGGDSDDDDEENGTIGDRLRELGVQEVVLVSHRPSEEIASLAAKIGADAFLGRQSAVEKAGFIEQRRLLERKIAYFGDVGPDHAVAAAADVAIAIAPPDQSQLPEAAVLLRQPDLEKAVLLRIMAQESIEIRRAGVQTAMAVNAACIFGAIFLSFPILGVVGLTNFGTYLTYRRVSRTLRDARLPESASQQLVSKS